MSSFVEITSNALRLLGDDPITSLTDDTERARLCNAIYEEIRDEVTRAALWNCATKRQVLASLSETPAFRWAYQSQLPADCLRVVAVYTGDIRIDYVVEGRKVLTDVSSCNLLYLTRITDPNEFDSLFISTYTARLASEMAFAITGSNTATEKFWTLYDRKVREARTIDSQESGQDELDVQSLVDVRHGGTV
jgi:hypothetical protein